MVGLGLPLTRLVIREPRGLEIPLLKKERRKEEEEEEGRELDIRGHSRRCSNQANTDTGMYTNTV
jgi:hypothetical protein